ncbi:MAG TPA: hypothetical protein VGM03_01575, partial [Phycisphaerae bacterium]
MLYYLFHSLVSGEHYAYENPLFRGVLAGLFCFLLILLSGPWVIRQLVKLKLGDRPEFDHASLNELMKSKADVPTMGGILIVAAVVLGVLLFADVASFYVFMGLLTLVWLAAVGWVDDWFKLTRARRPGIRDSLGPSGPRVSRRSTRDGLKSYEKLLFQVGLAVVLSIFIYDHGKFNYAQGVLADRSSLPLDSLGPSGPRVSRVPAYQVLSVPFYKYGLRLGTGSFLIVTVLVMTGTSNAVNLTDGLDGLAAG